MSKEYCPILTIGYDPPKGNATYDPRVCKTDCAWYNKTLHQCILHTINDNLLELIDYTCAISIDSPMQEVDIYEDI